MGRLLGSKHRPIISGGKENVRFRALHSVIVPSLSSGYCLDSASLAIYDSLRDHVLVYSVILR